MVRWVVGSIPHGGRIELFLVARESNVLFNDALNIFYLRLYGVRHMVKDHSDSKKGNPLPPHRLLLSIKCKGSFICTTDRITHTTAFVTAVVDHWLEREIAQWVHPMKDRSDDPSHHERTLFSLQPVLHDWCNKGRGMCYPVCWTVYIKYPHLPIEKSSPCNSGIGFPLSAYLWFFIMCPTPYNRKLKMCWVRC